MCQLFSFFPIFETRVLDWIARGLAGMSYSLYLMHLPILYMVAYWWGDTSSAVVIFLGLPASFILSLSFQE
jgi:peptidoglycan/LPS O-acetylase OafA/YrhL